MDQWLSYRPSDFLLFAPETYWRLFALTNEALWPLPVLSLPLLAGITALALTGRRVPAALVLAAAWVIVSEAFLATRYQPINWAAGYVRAAFLAQAALLATLAWQLRFDATGIRRSTGAALMVLAVAYPLVGWSAARPPAQAEVFAIAPDPTAIATLGLLLLARRGWAGAALSAVPLLWLAITCLTLHSLGEPTWIVPSAAGAMALIVFATIRSTQRADRD